MSVFGGTGSSFNQPPQQTPSLFGAQSGANTGFGFGNQQSGAQNTGFGLGAKPAASTPAGGGLFGGNTGQPSSGLFGQTNTNTSGTGSGGLFGSNNTNKPSTPAGGGLFGASNNTSGGLFGNPNTNASAGFGSTTGGGTNLGSSTSGSTGLFGSSTNTGTNTNTGGGLFGQSVNQSQPQKSLFGNTGSAAGQSTLGSAFNTNNTGGTSGGLFGNTGTNSNTGGGLFGSSSAGNTLGSGSNAPSGGGGLFGSSLQNPPKTNLFGNSSANTAPAGGSLFGAAQPQQNAAAPAAPPQPSLVASVDQASYILKGVAPAQKLYSSLSVPVAKRSAQESDIYNYEPKQPVTRNRTAMVRGNQGAHARSSFKSGTPKDLSVSLSGPFNHNSGRLVSSAPNSTSHNEPRKWINSYENFIAERPTTLVIDRKAQLQPTKLLLSSKSADLAPPVSTAPPTSLTNNPIDGAGSDAVASIEQQVADPDVSLFHRQANNMTLVQVNPRAIEEGYYVYPRLEVLASMSKSQLASVKNLVIGRENYGQIEYPGAVDLSHLNNLGDILGKLVIFEAGIVCVYPEEGRKAPRGRELNMPATISIENAWPKDAETHAVITNMEDKRMAKHILRLRKLCEERGGEFVTFTKGVWVFKVPHFSTWGLPVEDMVVDNDDYEEIQPDTEEPAVIVDSLVPQMASSPILAPLNDTPEGTNDNDVELDLGEQPQSWLEQLNHASKGVLLAKAQSLEAASKSTDKLNLGSILMPAVDNKQASSHKRRTASGGKAGPTSSLDTKMAASILQQLRKSLKKQTRVGNDLPLLNSGVDFNNLLTVYPLRKSLWQLLAILYEMPWSDNTEKLSSWFDRKVQQLDIQLDDDAVEATWQLLSKHEIIEAYYKASKSNNPHLALLVSMLASKDTQNIANLNAQQQLSDWKSTGFSHSIPLPIRRIWELIAGKLPSGTGLTWEQWLGIQMWYLNAPSIQSGVAALPSSLSGAKDPELAFLQAFSGTKQLRTALGELDLLESFLCLQALYQAVPHVVKADIRCYDNVCLKLSEVLHHDHDYVSSIFVALHVSDPKMALNAVRKILCEMPASTNLPAEFDVQDSIIHEARAFQEARLGEFRSQCEHLVQAGLYDEAHKVLLAEVAAEAVLSNQMQDIRELLTALEEHKSQISKWELGGGVYLTYAKVLADGPDNYSVMSLCNACRYIETPTLESREAVSRIAEWVASTPFAQRNIKPDMILGMKFAPSQARVASLQQAARLLF